MVMKQKHYLFVMVHIATLTPTAMTTCFNTSGACDTFEPLTVDSIGLTKLTGDYDLALQAKSGQSVTLQTGVNKQLVLNHSYIECTITSII
jgi:hypothetical protein